MKKFFLMFLVSVTLSLGSQNTAIAEEEAVDQTEGAVATQKLDVSDFAFCEGIENREPVGKKDVFTQEAGKVYLWTAVTGAAEPTEIKHVWYRGEERMAEIPLSIQYPRTRTWSSKTIMPEWTGDWHVDVVDSKDTLIKRIALKIEDRSGKNEGTESTTSETQQAPAAPTAPATTTPE